MTKLARDATALFEKRDIDILEQEQLIPVNLRDARANFSRLLMSVKYENNRFVITQHGEPAAVLIPVKDYRIFEGLDSIEDKNNSDGYTELTDQDIHQRGRNLGDGRGYKRQRTDTRVLKIKN